ncbi:MAG: hypothetical protein ACYC5K_04910 [Saccharofermentanales bacterium]
MTYQYPFGEYVKPLRQQDRTPKKIFILGVYASAVHAKWINNGQTICQALAVASEPYIFWDGNQAEAREIISRIKMPREVGMLVLPNKNLNGPSAKVLSDNILKPMGFTRKNAWLCDLLPESRLNPNQLRVIAEKYNPLISTYDLNNVTVPAEDGRFCDDIRCTEITEEILESFADTLILLGDIPIKQYLSKVSLLDFKNLRDYTMKYGYGKPIQLMISNKNLNVIPLAHPRQIGGLGRSSQFWFDEHRRWETSLL